MPNQTTFGLNRRDLMGAVAAGAAGVSLAESAHAQSKPEEAKPLQVIDFHNHYIGPSFAITANASTPATRMEVTLHVYDISQGLARTLSPMLLGRQLDLIPHTGVVIQGVEYFYGGGIQAMPTASVPLVFGLQPVQAIRLGVTTKTVAELRAFLRGVSHRYTQATYDRIVTYKTAFYSFYLPVAAGMLVGGVPPAGGAYAVARSICLQMGHYFQVRQRGGSGVVWGCAGREEGRRVV